MAGFGAIRTAAAAALVVGAITVTTATGATAVTAAGGTGELTLLSTSSSGVKANFGVTGILSVSADGSVLVFESQNSTNLVSGLTNNRQVYAKDVLSGSTTVVSAAADGSPGNGLSWQSRVSSNGRYVAFISDATNLHPDDTDGNDDVFVKDRLTGEVMLATTDANGVKGTGTWASGPPRVSDDGETVVFAYNAGLVDEYVGGVEFYAKNLATGAVTMLTDPTYEVNGTGGTVSLDLTADGSTAVVDTFEPLTADDVEDYARPDVFAVDTATGAATLVSVPLGGETDPLSAAYFPSISDDGTTVTYQGFHRGLTGSTQTQVWTKDLTTGILRQVTAGANALSQDPEISPDGGYVVYASNGTNLVTGDTNGVSDVFLEDLATGEVVLVSQTDGGTLGNGNTFIGVPTNEGRSVFFQTKVTNLSPLDTDCCYQDVYRKVFPIPDSDGDGISDDVDPDPNTPSASFDDGSGTTGEILSNGTGAPLSIIDLPDPGGVRITTGGTTGQVTVKACGVYTLRVAAGSEIEIACGSIVITVGPGGPLVVELGGEKELSIEIPSGVSVRISTPVNDDFTIEYLSGSDPVIVREPSEPWDYEYPDPRETWLSSGTRSFTTNLPPTVDAVSLSTANAVIGEQVELTATFSDPGVDDTHTCAVTWASGVTVPGTVTGGQCTSSYSYSALGLNSVSVRVTDDAGDAGWGGASVLVFDPDTYWTYDPSTTFDVAGLGIDVDPVSQDVWVVKNNQNKIAKFASDGTFQFEVGGFGTAPGLFNSPSVVAVHPTTGDAYITDVGGNRIQQFDSNGNFVRAFGAGAGTPFDNPLGIDVDAAGTVWVADVFNGKVQKFSSTGAYLGTLGGTGTAPYAVSVDPDGKVWVSDFTGSRDRVHKINPATGVRELTITGFGQPVDITFDDRGQAHIVNSNTKEVRTYTLAGGFVASRPMPVVASNGWYSQPYPYRVAINGEGQLLLTNASSQVAVFDPPTPPDTDGDGIPDAIECDPDVAGTFCDPDGGGHIGEVISNGTGAPLTFVDLPDPEGVKVIVGGTAGQARIRLCGGFTMGVSAGNEVDVTCGSITIEVLAGGPVTLTLEGGDGVTTITVPQGVTAYVSDVVDDQFSIEYRAGDDPVVVEINGVATNVDQDSTDLDFSANVAPTIDVITAPTAPASLAEQPTAVGVAFSDPGSSDTHTCDVDWGDGQTTTGTVDGLTCDASHAYTQAGVFTVEVTVTDDAGDVDTATALVVVYDPDGGFVTGGGWFESPEGAYVAAPELTGKATFGFVSKYKKGATVPTGNTQFLFKAGDLEFRSTEYDWLVVTGAKGANFKGTGTINGTGDYRFMIWADDGDPDTLQIRIWSDSGGVVYDNGVRQPISGGSIVVHSK